MAKTILGRKWRNNPKAKGATVIKKIIHQLLTNQNREFKHTVEFSKLAAGI